MYGGAFVVWSQRQESFVFITFGLIVIARGKMRRKARNNGSI